MKMLRSAEELAEILATDADDHYRFTSATRKQVAKTALADVLRDLVPLMPMLLAIHEEGRCDRKEQDHIAELIDTLER